MSEFTYIDSAEEGPRPGFFNKLKYFFEEIFEVAFVLAMVIKCRFGAKL